MTTAFMFLAPVVLGVTCLWAVVSMYGLEREARSKGVRLPTFPWERQLRLALPSDPFKVERSLHTRATADAWHESDEEEFAKIGIQL